MPQHKENVVCYVEFGMEPETGAGEISLFSRENGGGNLSDKRTILV